MENTERCGCGRAVTISVHTQRSLIGNKPICDGCLPPVAAYFGGIASRYQAERLPMSREQIEAEVMDALYGKRRHTDTLERQAQASDVTTRLAWHEAGHAVVAWQLGLPILETCIDLPDGGHTRFVADSAPAGWTATNDAAVLFAGHFAELRWCGSTPTGSAFDEDAAHALLDRGGLDTPMAVAIVEDILDRHAADVRLVADALIRRRHLTGEQLAELLPGCSARAEPEAPSEARASTDRVITDPAEIRAHRIQMIREGFARRGEVWDAAAEREANRYLDDEKRHGVIRSFGWSPTLR